MTSVFPAQCYACSRLADVRDPDTGTRLVDTCAAFPGGIPGLMADGGDHRDPLPGDNGLRFDPADTAQARDAFAAWQRFAAAAA
jgi:hypothetical protein